MIALGEKAVQDLGFYSSIHQKAEELSFKTSEEDATPVDSVSDYFSSNEWKMIKDGALDKHEPIPETDTKLISLSDDLDFVFDDLKQQVVNYSSKQLHAGVKKFCERYRKIAKQRFSTMLWYLLFINLDEFWWNSN